jgi:hypothetical protein
MNLLVSTTEEGKMVNRKLIPWLLSLAIFLLMMYATRTIEGAARAPKKLGTVLTGKFVARADGPPVTGFGVNRQSYIFEMLSPLGSEFVTLSDTFFIYEPQLSEGVMDYSKLYKIKAVRNQKCDGTLEDISRRFIFDSHGRFVEMRFALTYAKNLPSLTLPWQSPLPCYVVSAVQPPAQVATASN